MPKMARICGQIGSRPIFATSRRRRVRSPGGSPARSTGTSSQRLEEEKRLDPDAKDLVLRGRASFQRPFSITSRQEGLQAFERALMIDPSSVGARIGIAAVLTFNVLDGWSTSPQQDEARADQLLIEALERDAGS